MSHSLLAVAYNPIHQDVLPISSADRSISKLDFTKAVVSNLASDHSAESKDKIVEKAENVLNILLNSQNKTFCESYACYPNSKFSRSSLYDFIASGDVLWWDVFTQTAVNFVDSLEISPSEWEEATLVADDTSVNRNRSKCVDLQSKQMSHNDNTFFQGFLLLSVGLYLPSRNMFIPLRAQLITGVPDKQVVQEAHKVDKRTKLGRYINRTRCEKFPVLLDMLKELQRYGIQANHIAMDSWYVSPKNIIQLNKLGYDVLGHLKANKTRFYDAITGETFNIKSELAGIKQRVEAGEQLDGVFTRPVLVRSEDEQPVRANIVFSQNWQEDTKAERPYVALISTDCFLEPEQVTKLYAHRWSIEVNYFMLKDKLGLISGNRTRLITSNLAILYLCHVRYLVTLQAQMDIHQGKEFSQVSKTISQEQFYIFYFFLIMQILQALCLNLSQICNFEPNRAYLASYVKAIKKSFVDCKDNILATTCANILEYGNTFGKIDDSG